MERKNLEKENLEKDQIKEKEENGSNEMALRNEREQKEIKL